MILSALMAPNTNRAKVLLWCPCKRLKNSLTCWCQTVHTGLNAFIEIVLLEPGFLFCSLRRSHLSSVCRLAPMGYPLSAALLAFLLLLLFPFSFTSPASSKNCQGEKRGGGTISRIRGCTPRPVGRDKSGPYAPSRDVFTLQKNDAHPCTMRYLIGCA